MFAALTTPSMLPTATKHFDRAAFPKIVETQCSELSLPTLKKNGWTSVLSQEKTIQSCGLSVWHEPCPSNCLHLKYKICMYILLYKVMHFQVEDGHTKFSLSA